MTLPDGFRFRPLAEDECDAVAAMFNEEGRALVGEDIVPPDFARAWWRHPDTVAGRDMIAVADPRDAVAAAFLLRCESPYQELFAVGGVALAHHGRGIGAAMIEEIERVAPQFPAPLLRAGSFDLPGPRALFEAHGFRLVRRFLTMTRRLDGPLEPPPDVPGIRITGYDRTRDDAAVYEVLAGAFADHWAESDWTPEFWESIIHDRDGYDPGLWWLAWSDDELAGALVGIRDGNKPATGIVAMLGVAARHRGRGIGEALLRTAFAGFHAAGLACAELAVDAESLTGATRLYERVGMQSRPRFVVFEKELRAGPAATV
jgi:mycothiol synthase